MRKDELREAAVVATRAFDDYEYYTNWFPEKQGGKELVFFTNSEKNIAFYRKLGFELFDFMRNMPGTLNSRHLLSYTYPSAFFSFPSSFF